jgi:hypothetical protein
VLEGGAETDDAARMKDWLIKKTIPPLLNDRLLKPYGELTEFELDSATHSIEGMLRLKGETEPVRIRVGKYQIVFEGEDSFVIIHELVTSREWLTRLAHDFVVGRKFRVPDGLAKFVPMLR